MEGLCKRQRPAVYLTYGNRNRTSPSAFKQIIMSNTSKLPARDFWASISNWLLAVECKDTTAGHRQAVHQWYDAFLESDDADDKDTRLEVKMLRDDILNLFNTLDLYDRNQRIEEIQKLAL